MGPGNPTGLPTRPLFEVSYFNVEKTNDVQFKNGILPPGAKMNWNEAENPQNSLDSRDDWACMRCIWEDRNRRRPQDYVLQLQ